MAGVAVPQDALLPVQATRVHAAVLAHAVPAQVSWQEQDDGGWVHRDSGDRWSGPLCADAPMGQGEYLYADSQLRVTACISGEAAASLVFSGEACRMAWPDGSSYSGTLVESAFHGQGTFTWANRDVYCGKWKQAKRHGMGNFTSYQGALIFHARSPGDVLGRLGRR